MTGTHSSYMRKWRSRRRRMGVREVPLDRPDRELLEAIRGYLRQHGEVSRPTLTEQIRQWMKNPLRPEGDD